MITRPFRRILDIVRRFELCRNFDITGVSGVGIVARGVRFDDGVTVIRWVGDIPSTVIWQQFEDAVAIHGHDGATRFVFLDDEGA